MYFCFRETYGGLHLKYKVNPDIAIVTEKAMKWLYYYSYIRYQKIMEKSENSFVSSTFGRKKLDLRQLLP